MTSIIQVDAGSTERIWLRAAGSVDPTGGTIDVAVTAPDADPPDTWTTATWAGTAALNSTGTWWAQAYAEIGPDGLVIAEGRWWLWARLIIPATGETVIDPVHLLDIR